MFKKVNYNKMNISKLFITISFLVIIFSSVSIVAHAKNTHKNNREETLNDEIPMPTPTTIEAIIPTVTPTLVPSPTDNPLPTPTVFVVLNTPTPDATTSSSMIEVISPSPSPIPTDNPLPTPTPQPSSSHSPIISQSDTHTTSINTIAPTTTPTPTPNWFVPLNTQSDPVQSELQKMFTFPADFFTHSLPKQFYLSQKLTKLQTNSLLFIAFLCLSLGILLLNFSGISLFFRQFTDYISEVKGLVYKKKQVVI